MKILSSAIVSNSDMNKNYKACIEKAETFGRIFVLKNNQPEAVLFSVDAYEKVASVIEYLEEIDDSELSAFVESLAKDKKRGNRPIIEK